MCVRHIHLQEHGREQTHSIRICPTSAGCHRESTAFGLLWGFLFIVAAGVVVVVVVVAVMGVIKFPVLLISKGVIQLLSVVR